MVGTVSRAIVILLALARSAFADVPVTSYECSPGTTVDGVGCSCPKNYRPGRAPADEGQAICVPSGTKPAQIQVGGYPQLVREANDAATAYDCVKAEELYEKALKLNAKGVEALVGSGNCMTKQSKWTNAHARFDAALAINAKFEPALWSKAEAYRLAFKKDEAIDAYRKYLEAFPNAAKAKTALTKLGASTVVEKPGKIVKSPKRTEDVTLTVTGTAISANGVTVSPNGAVADWIAIYGKPDRTWDTGKGINKIHTWDKLGLIIYEPISKPGRATSATFLFKPMGIAYDPKSLFRGTIIVDGFKLTPTTSLGTVKTQPGATMPYGVSSVVFARGTFNVFTSAKAEGLELVEIAMWKVENGAAGSASAPPVAGTSKVAAADVRVEVVSAGGVKVQGKDIGGRPMLTDLKKLFGDPTRVWNKAGAVNHIHIWDDLGVVAYEPVGSGKVTSLSMPYKPDGSDRAPKTAFKGRVAIDTKGFYNFNTLTTIVKRPGATQPYGKDSVVFDYGDVHLFTKATGAETIELVEVSFWQKK